MNKFRVLILSMAASSIVSSAHANETTICEPLKKIELKPANGSTKKILTLGNGQTFIVNDATAFVSIVGTNTVLCGNVIDGHFELTSIEAR